MADQSSRAHFESPEIGRLGRLWVERFGSRISPDIIADIFQFIDIVLILLTAMFAKVAYIDSQFGAGTSALPYALAALTCGIIATVLFRATGAGFSIEVRNRSFRPARLIMLLLLSFMLLLTVAYVFKVSALFSRGWLIVWFISALLALLINRAVYEKVQHWLVANGLVVRNVAIFGKRVSAEVLAKSLAQVPGVRVIGTLNKTADLEKLERYCEAGGHPTDKLDDVIIVTKGLRSRAISEFMSEINGLPIQIKMCVDPLAYNMPLYGVSQIGHNQMIDMRRKKVGHWGHLCKAIEDYVLGSLMLLLALPLFAVIAIAIKMESPGPVFFRQRRHGLNNRIISIYKFRTMTVMEDGDVVRQATQNDTRVTRVGAILRKTSLDELPQILNVLRGEMSLVGPRPHALAHNEQYGALLKSAKYASRHLVKPGITGWAQINGFRGPTQDPRLMEERVRCDLEYIDNWSVWFDIEILLLTLVYGFVGKNAY